VLRALGQSGDRSGSKTEMDFSGKIVVWDYNGNILGSLVSAKSHLSFLLNSPNSFGKSSQLLADCVGIDAAEARVEDVTILRVLLAAAIIDFSVMYKFSFVQKDFNDLISIPNLGSEMIRYVSIDGPCFIDFLSWWPRWRWRQLGRCAMEPCSPTCRNNHLLRM
jgi:hypothetical protein